MGCTQSIMSNYQPPSAGPNQGQEQAVESSASTGTSLFGQAKTMKQKVMKNVRWVTALTGLGLCVAAVFSFLSCILSFSFSGIILCVYLCPIGIIISITETEKFFYQSVIEKFPILRTHTGRGFTYIFIAGLTISVNTIACWIVGVTLLVEGIVSIMFHYNKDPKEQNAPMHSIESGNPPAIAGPTYTSASAQPKSNPAAEPGSRILSEMDRGDDFGGSSYGNTAASAAFDYASRNPDQAFAAGQAGYGFAKENPELAKKA